MMSQMYWPTFFWLFQPPGGGFGPRRSSDCGIVERRRLEPVGRLAAQLVDQRLDFGLGARDLPPPAAGSPVSESSAALPALAEALVS